MKTAEQEVSPKVLASAATSVALTVVVAVLAAITPEMFTGLGAWAPLAYAAVVSLGGAIAGYIKKDPRRK